MIENGYPVTFQTYGLAEEWAGGPRAWAPAVVPGRRPAGTFAANLDRFKFAPWGTDGGEPKGRLTLTRDGAETDLHSKVSNLEIRQGDVITLQTSGGGGHGDLYTPGRCHRRRRGRRPHPGLTPSAATMG